MTEEEAKEWIDANFDVSRETWIALDRYVGMLVEESGRQNLISAATIPTLWQRHIVDSAQLLLHAGSAGVWADVGSGAGLPSAVIAILAPRPMKWIEPRRGRVEFLNAVVQELGLPDIEVVPASVEKYATPAPVSVVSARAYAPLDRLFDTCAHLAGPETLWILPKGRSWKNELDIAALSWHYQFHVKQSVTDPDSAILLFRSVKRKGSR